MGLSEKINVFEGDAVELLPKFDKTYDLIFIDAAKRKISVFLKRSFKNVKIRYNNRCR